MLSAFALACSIKSPQCEEMEDLVGALSPPKLGAIDGPKTWENPHINEREAGTAV